MRSKNDVLFPNFIINNDKSSTGNAFSATQKYF